MDYSLLGSSVHGILQARTLEWVAGPSSRGSSQPRDQTHISYFYLHWQAGSLPGKPIHTHTHTYVCVCIYIHTHTHIYKYIYICIYTHTLDIYIKYTYIKYIYYFFLPFLLKYSQQIALYKFKVYSIMI